MLNNKVVSTVYNICCFFFVHNREFPPEAFCLATPYFTHDVFPLCGWKITLQAYCAAPLWNIRKAWRSGYREAYPDEELFTAPPPARWISEINCFNHPSSFVCFIFEKEVGVWFEHLSLYNIITKKVYTHSFACQCLFNFILSVLRLIVFTWNIFMFKRFRRHFVGDCTFTRLHSFIVRCVLGETWWSSALLESSKRSWPVVRWPGPSIYWQHFSRCVSPTLSCKTSVSKRCPPLKLSPRNWRIRQ